MKKPIVLIPTAGKSLRDIQKEAISALKEYDETQVSVVITEESVAKES